MRSELVAALRQPGISTTLVSNAFEATAKALAADRSRDQRRVRSPVVLVLVEPLTLDRCLEVVEVLQRFASGVEYWVFQRMDGMHRLRVLRPADVERWKLEVRIAAGNSGSLEPPPRPEIKVMDGFKTPPGPALAGPDIPVDGVAGMRGESPARLLSDEELRMLLEPDSREPGDESIGTT